jgi:hypothetical protein
MNFLWLAIGSLTAFAVVCRNDGVFLGAKVALLPRWKEEL